MIKAIICSTLLLLLSATAVSAAPRASNASVATDGAVRIWPSAKVKDLHPQSWYRIKVSPSGKRLIVYFWMGPKACNGLGRVDVTRHNGELNVQLWTGIPPHKIGFLCPEYAQLYKTVVHLNRPIIT